MAKTPEQQAAEAAAMARQEAEAAEAARLADLEAARVQAAGGVTVDPGLSDPTAASAVTNATAPGVLAGASTEPAQLAARLAGKRDAPKSVTCAGCGAAWPAERVGAGATIPCLCGRLLVVA